MLGTWRLLLAMLVANGHLLGAWWAASMAVVSFYVISGFLMTLILNQTYGFKPAGFGAFWRARLLRLMPSYWVGCAMSLVLILVLADGVAQGWNPKLVIPSRFHEIFSNLTMIGIAHPDKSVAASGAFLVPGSFATLVPPAWALSLELVFYLALSLVFARSARLAGMLLVFGLIYTVWALTSEHSAYFRYFFFPAGALPFSVGALLYFAMRVPAVQKASTRRDVFLWALGVYFFVFTAASMNQDIRLVLFYLNIPATAAVICVLMQIVPTEKLRKRDQFLGDLSYPVYLFHWQIGLIVFALTGFERRTLELFLLSIPLIFLAAILDRRFVSGPIDQWRRRSRPTSPQVKPL